MLPVRALEEIGIHEPELGMEIPASITLPDGEKLEKTFILSGYYTDYRDPAIYRPAGYFSQEFLQRLPIDIAENTTLLIQQKDNIDDEAIEDMLYQDVEMRDDSQQFFGPYGRADLVWSGHAPLQCHVHFSQPGYPAVRTAENYGNYEETVKIYRPSPDRQAPGRRLCPWRGGRNPDHSNRDPPAPFRDVPAG